MMDFKDLIKQLGDRAAKLKEQTLTEEATKTALIMPFLQTLGYDIFNPSEVVPEFDTDIPGLKKGEKVDYAVFKDGQPKILIECKHWKQNLDFHDGQLLRYFHVSKAKFAILTNGIVYRFFTDLFEPNKMDDRPFLDFDITNMSEPQIEGLKKFHKSYFDEIIITTAANELIHVNAIKQLLNKELKTPSEEFVKFITQNVYSGKVTQKVVVQFTDLVKRSAQQVINEMINDRLASAMKQESKEQPAEPEQGSTAPNKDEAKGTVETTEEEMEGFYIVKAICRQKVEPGRIAHRDAQTYFAILLDDNNRKPICRLYLNRNKKYLETFEIKGGEKRDIQTIDDIYKYTNEILKTIDGYETPA
jgi:hypothetical protein